MAKSHNGKSDKPDEAPALTAEQIEAAVLTLMQGRHNTIAGELARPEKIQAKRERFARALRNEANRAGEAAARLTAEKLKG